MPRSKEINIKDFMKQHQKRIPILNPSLEYVSPKEYAKLIQAHLMTIYGLLNAGSIEGAIKVGRHWKIPVMKDVTISNHCLGSKI